MLGLISLLVAARTSVSIQAPRPNVVFFLVDDLGWQDTSLSFGLREKLVGRHFRTPNVEALAKRGVQVNQAYAAAPVCTPSRVTLLSGINPARNHITNWVYDGRDTDGPDPTITLPDWRAIGFQPGDATTLPQVFHDSGYYTVEIGKAHFGAWHTKGERPTNLGFDRSIAGSAAGNPNSYYGLDNFARKKKNPNDPPALDDIQELDAYHGKDIYLTEALTAEAVKEIHRSAEMKKPLFLWFATYAVHAPIQANKKYLSHYKGMDPTEAAYATMVESYDVALGQLVSTLKKMGELDNTIIVFTSDNGGLSVSQRGGYPNLHNLPLRSGKGSAYEGGTRVPLVFAGPGIPAGKVLAKTFITSEDLFATMPDLAGIRANAPDGYSFKTEVTQGKDSEREQVNVWHFPHYRGGRGPGLQPFSSIRMGAFKAIFFYPDRKWELYNLETDIGETRDLSAFNPKQLKILADRLLLELRKMGAQFPTDPKTGQLIEPVYL
ncbi:MAG: sulfatase-like hydrolase/transferase [Armatimonadetes bacterium]|nr:sulfatase-like hydrolase/transferase [Armatimonadota bacterium]